MGCIAEDYPKSLSTPFLVGAIAPVGTIVPPRPAHPEPTTFAHPIVSAARPKSPPPRPLPKRPLPPPRKETPAIEVVPPTTPSFAHQILPDIKRWRPKEPKPHQEQEDEGLLIVKPRPVLARNPSSDLESSAGSGEDGTDDGSGDHMIDWQKEQEKVYGNNGRTRRRNANYESRRSQLAADAAAQPAVVEEPAPLLPPSYTFADLLPPEILLILQDDLSTPATPPSLEPVIEGLQALLPFAREALKSLRIWDSGWEEISIHHRVEVYKAKFVVKGGMGDGQSVLLGRERYVRVLGEGRGDRPFCESLFDIEQRLQG